MDKKRKIVTFLTNLLQFALVIDGTIRIIFSTLIYYLLPVLYQSFDLYFHIRWFGLGVLELIFAFGLGKRQTWALYGLAVLSLTRIYTVIVFPPQGLFLPIYSNLITYILKLVVMVLVIFLFIKRKRFRS